MSKQSIINPLSLTVGTLFLIYLASIRLSSAADLNGDPQAEAAYLLQRPLTWISSTDGTRQSGRSSDKVLTPQEQAQRVFQPINDVAVDGAKSVGFGVHQVYELVEPQLQADRVLSHNFH